MAGAAGAVILQIQLPQRLRDGAFDLVRHTKLTTGQFLAQSVCIARKHRS